MEVRGLFSVPLWVPLLALILFLSYKYLTRNKNYWKNRGIPYESSDYIFGFIYKLFHTHFHDLEIQRYKTYGRVYGLFEGVRPYLYVGDPELIKQILVKDFPMMSNRRQFSFGDEVMDKILSILKVEDWRRIRPAVSPAFSSGKLRKMAPLVLDCTKGLRDNFMKSAEKGENVDLKKYFSNFTMDVIARCAFGTKLDTQNDPNNVFVTMGRKGFGRDLSLIQYVALFFPGIAKLFKKKALSSEGTEFFKQVTRKIMGEREKGKTRQEDFLQLMVDAQKEGLKDDDTGVVENSVYSLGEQEDFQPHNTRSKELTQNEALAQCILFFLAGFDTTASVLSFTGYLLALHPEIQRKLLKEIDQHKKKYGNEITMDSVNELKYLEMVISESMRLYPPALRLERAAVEDYRLEGLGITIPKGMVVGIPVYAMHHDPEFFPDPKKFDPERFSEENVSSIQPYTYMPFGAGPRNCVGMRFALMTVKLCLINVLTDVEFSRSQETKVPLDFYRGGGLFQPREVTVAVTRRVKE